jgi:autotransporter passenger strand-loop-strand repeat protein
VFTSTGTAINTTINSGGLQAVGNFEAGAGTASNTIINSGGEQNITAAGIAISTTVSGGLQIVGDGNSLATASATTILSGGTEITENLASAVSTTVGSGGLLDTLFGGTIVSAVISGGTVTVGNATSVGGNLTFAGSGGVLEFETNTMPTAVIGGLAAGDAFVFDNATFGPGATVTLISGSPDVLSATLGGNHYTLHLDSGQNYAAFAFDAIPTTNVHLVAAFPFATAIEVMSVSSVGVGSSTSGGSLGLGQAQRVFGTTLSQTVANGGEQGVNHGGTANATTVGVGGVQLVSSGGISLDASVDGIQFIFAGGSAANAAITESGAQQVLGTATSTIDSGAQYVGGKASATTIATFGLQYVLSGGTAGATTDAWEQQVRSAGTAVSTTITSDGFQDVAGGAVAISTTVLNGGEQDVSGKASATIVSNGGFTVVELGGVLSGLTLSNGGVAFVKAGGTATGAVIDGGTLELQGGASLGTGAVTFGITGSDGRLTFVGTPQSNTISGFAAGDTIDLAGVGFARGNTVTSAGGVVTVSAGTSHFAVHLAPSGLSGGTFHLKPDGNEDTATGAGGTVIGYDQIASIASGQTSTNISVGDAHVQVVQSGATALGVVPTAVALRDPRSRWGSSSRQGRLMFSWRLVLAPPEALETVVIHELAHLRVFGHGPRFWAVVASRRPDHLDWRRWLRTHSLELHGALSTAVPTPVAATGS